MADPAKHISLRDAAPRAPSHARPPAASISPTIITGLVKLGDFCTVMIAGALGLAFYMIAIINDPESLERYTLTALLGATLFVVGMQRVGCYDFKRLGKLRWQATHVGMLWGATVGALLLLGFLGKISGGYSRGWALLWATTTFGLLLLERGALRLVLGRWTRQGRLARNVVLVGAGELGEHLAQKLQRSAQGTVKIIGVFDDRLTRIPESLGRIPLLGTTDDLLLFARQVPVDEIIVALPLNAEQRLKTICAKLSRLPVDLRLSAGPIAEVFPVRGISHVGDVPMLEIVDRPLKHWSAVVKWIEDMMLGGLLLTVAAPLMAIIALLIKLDSRGPVFFAQDRFGFNNQVIRVFKFRTMYVDRGDPTGALRTVRHDPRVTRIGRFLRAFSFDELPQLLNVMRGEMSLIGPRPHPIAMKAENLFYHDAVEDYMHRHKVKPGITGWAQVNGLRGEIDSLAKARQRVVYDLNYIDSWSLWLDFKILLMSFRILVSRSNAY